MTLHLVLTRHGKSSWKAPNLSDHDRPLKKRGRKSAPIMGRWIAERLRPNLALVSSARRAVETWQGIAGCFYPVPELRLLPALYHADADGIAGLLRETGSGTVLIVGHNPGLADFAAAVLDTIPDHPDFARFPTAATLIAAFDIDRWDELRPGTGRALAFATPRELMR